jgi:hypothetical protein
MTRGAQNAAQAPAEGLFVVAEKDLSHGGDPRAGLALGLLKFLTGRPIWAIFFWMLAYTRYVGGISESLRKWRAALDCHRAPV